MKNWKHITTKENVMEIIKNSHNHSQIIFKDSKTCGISAYAKERLTEGFEFIDGKADFNYLDLLANRDISNFIAKELNVIHQSPQIIVLKDGKVAHIVTHHSIESKKIANHL